MSDLFYFHKVVHIHLRTESSPLESEHVSLFLLRNQWDIFKVFGSNADNSLRPNISREAGMQWIMHRAVRVNKPGSVRARGEQCEDMVIVPIHKNTRVHHSDEDELLPCSLTTFIGTNMKWLLIYFFITFGTVPPTTSNIIILIKLQSLPSE